MIDPITVAGYLIAVMAVAAWWRERRRRQRDKSRHQTEQQRFSALLERLGIGHWIRDLDSGAMWWSTEFRRMHGLTADEPAERMRLLEHILPEDRDPLVASLKAAYASGQGECRYRSRDADRQTRHHLVRIAVSTSAEGSRIAYGFNLETTEQIRLQDQVRKRSAYLEAIVSHLPMGISVFDQHLKLRFWNDRFTEVLNLPDELIQEGVDFAELIRIPALRGEYGPGDVEAMVMERRALALKFDRHRFERIRPNGRTHLVIGEPIRQGGEVIGFVTTYTDITEQKHESEQLQQTTEMLRTLIENIPVGVSMVDSELRVLAWNQRFLEVMDFPAFLFEPPVVTLPSLFQYNIDRGEYGPVDDPQALMDKLTERALQFEPHALERVRPNGRVLSIIGRPLSSGGFVTIYADITEQTAREAEIKRLARTDPLTGLDNRGAFATSLRQALAQSRRRHAQLAVLFIDMDRFKPVNDTLGHETGDQVLIEIAHRLKSRLRESDLVARMGGDEFVVALTDLEGEVDAAQVAGELVSSLSAAFITPKGEVFLSPSIGIALSPQDAMDEAELLRLADLAMYHVKREGGAAYRFFAPTMNEAVMQRIDIERRLRSAIHDDALELHYQPIHGLSEGLPLLGFEALLRWPRPEGGYIPPDEFIPLAEASDLIRLLGLWVSGAVARQMTVWSQLHLPDLPTPWRININLSARQFDTQDLAQELAQSFANQRQSLERITFEITEGVMMTDPGKAQTQLTRLREMGALCAVDDFGTGYSSLCYLRHFAIDSLKIDRSFIQALGPEPDAQAIVVASVGLAHQLGLQTVAEGVETMEQMEWLRQMGCDAIQGYLMSRPLTAHQVPEYLQRVAQEHHHPSVSPSA